MADGDEHGRNRHKVAEQDATTLEHDDYIEDRIQLRSDRNEPLDGAVTLTDLREQRPQLVLEPH